jgi:hypothetical protein
MADDVEDGGADVCVLIGLWTLAKDEAFSSRTLYPGGMQGGAGANM